MNLKTDHIVNTNKLLKSYTDEKLMIGGESANFSKYFNLKRLGVHYLKISPGYRSSMPHAESLEEEFVYILSGEIDLWFNGRIKKMKSFDCVGFPAGTGDGHCFINNSKDPVEMFVVGDRSMSDNQYAFHINPEQEDDLGKKWWKDMPVHDLGAHDGLPGALGPKLIHHDIYTLNGPDHIEEANWSYPGDQETFCDSVCLSRKFGMKSIAVWLEKMPLGKRSSWPHAHSIEEEFVFTLSHGITVWLDHSEVTTKKYEAIDFKAGSGVAHTLINKTDSIQYFLCVGECEPQNDKIYYPLHPKRNEEMRVKGELWIEKDI